MSRQKIKELISEMQKGGSNVNELVKELMELKKSLGDPVPSVSSDKLSGNWKLERKSDGKPKRAPRSRKKKSPKKGNSNKAS